MMASSEDLIGSGMPPLLAQVLGNSPNALTCTGTALATAATIKTKNTELVPASSQTGAVMPSTAKIGSPYYLNNQQSTSGVLYVQSGDYLNGVQNDSLTLAQYKAAVMVQYKKGYWSSVKTA